MRRENVPAGRYEWALRLTATEPRRPLMRFEVAAGQRFLLRQNHNIVLLGLVERHYEGVDVLSTGSYESPIAPIRADTARDMPDPDTPEWHGRWAHRFAGLLDKSRLSPIHTGEWLLSARREDATKRWLQRELVRDFPDASLDWFGAGWAGVLPLRQLSDPQAGRVKAHRRLAREGILPPVLLLRASCIDGYVILDGHDRFVAALAEDTSPALVMLQRSPTTEHREQAARWIIEGHTKVTQPQGNGRQSGRATTRNAPRNRRTHSIAGKRVSATTFRWRPCRCRAGHGAYGRVVHKGGAASWDQLAALASPTWLAEVSPPGFP